MRYYGWLLIACLLQTAPASALEVFGDFLYWQVTEPVDWVLNTNRLPSDQFVAYETIEYDGAPGFRIGVAREQQWRSQFSYTYLHSRSTDSAAGNLTPAFLGGKLAFSDEPKAEPPYFDDGQVAATINYHVLDWDVGKSAHWTESWQARPVFGVRAAWITQSFESGFQGEWPDALLSKRIAEHMENNFWGIGPKIGIENVWNVWRGEESTVSCVANFYTAYLLGSWSIEDVTHMTAVHDSQASTFERTIPITDRDFGALTFQALLGLTLRYRRWSATAGYEINDWLNQCQIFDDATGPHNNDLILQGLTVSFGCSF